MADPLTLARLLMGGQPQTAGTAFEPVTRQQQLQNFKQLEGQDAAWRTAEGSPWKPAEPGPVAKMLTNALTSQTGQRLMDLSNFLGPGPKMMPRRTMAPEGPKGIRAYHGSPADFDRFDSRFIDTGEGAQKYGRGHYFAEAEPVTNRYRGPNGRTYEVNIKADPSQFLDYDVPISQQPQARAAVEQAGFLPYTVVDAAGKRIDLSRGMSKADAEAYAAAKGGKAIPKEDFDFDAISKAYRGRDAEISKALADAGVPGIRYKDAGSRDGPGGTSNYVVFDDNLIEIIKKYGLAGLLMGGAATQGGMGQETAY